MNKPPFNKYASEDGMTAKVIVAGSINMDCVASVQSIPRPGETVSGNDLNYYPGGKGANQAVAAARLGAPTSMIACLGNDGFGDTLTEFLSAQNIDLTAVKTLDNTPTGTAFITVAADAENAITVIAGANAAVTKEQVQSAQISTNDVLVAQNEIPPQTTLAFFEKGKEKGALTIYNPAPAIDIPEEILNLTDILIVNETELDFYFSAFKNSENTAQTTEDKARALQKRSDQTVIVTLGSKGAMAITNDGAETIEGIAVKAVDTTGAGDCFVGALASRLAAGDELTDAMRFANHAASIAVQNHGAGVGMPTIEQLGSTSQMQARP